MSNPILLQRFNALANLRDENGFKVLLEGRNSRGIPTLFIRASRVELLDSALEISSGLTPHVRSMRIFRTLGAFGFKAVDRKTSHWLQINQIIQSEFDVANNREGSTHGTERILIGHGDCPITIESYKEFILEKLNVTQWASALSEEISPIAKILASEPNLIRELRAHWDSHPVPVQSPQMLSPPPAQVVQAFQQPQIGSVGSAFSPSSQPPNHDNFRAFPPFSAEALQPPSQAMVGAFANSLSRELLSIRAKSPIGYKRKRVQSPSESPPYHRKLRRETPER